MDTCPSQHLQTWVPALPDRALGRKPVELKLDHTEIALYRDSNGKAHAIDNRCPHRKMRLALGRVEGDRLVCPYHGWHFGPDGTGLSPGTPGIRVQTGCYEVAQHRSMLWIRRSDQQRDSEAPSDALPALQYPGYRFVGRLHHAVRAPMELLLDNMMELEHTAAVHSIFGFEPGRLHEVRTEARTIDGGIEIDYEGPQRRLPLYLSLFTGIRAGDNFRQRAVVHHVPSRAFYELEWFDATSGQRRPFSLIFVIYFNECSANEGSQSTFVFASAQNLGARLTAREFSFLLMHHIDRELRSDVRLVEQLQLSPTEAASGVQDRFDRPLSMRRRAMAEAGAKALVSQARQRVVYLSSSN
jgi:phenylpropionate dioxygenase-like ring-hydroxylating dioxygenase large terminal subunit